MGSGELGRRVLSLTKITTQPKAAYTKTSLWGFNGLVIHSDMNRPGSQHLLFRVIERGLAQAGLFGHRLSLKVQEATMTIGDHLGSVMITVSHWMSVRMTSKMPVATHF